MKYTKETLEMAVKDCVSVAGVLRKLGLKEAGGTHSHISRRIQRFGIDTSHFLGQERTVAQIIKAPERPHGKKSLYFVRVGSDRRLMS